MASADREEMIRRLNRLADASVRLPMTLRDSFLLCPAWVPWCTLCRLAP